MQPLKKSIGRVSFETTSAEPQCADEHAGIGLGQLPTPLAVSPAVAMHLLGVGRTLLYELINSSRLRTVKLGSRRLVLMASIHDLLADSEVRS